MAFHHFVNTRYFSEAATEWKKNGGRYTMAPQGSREYFQYWEEQERRCKYGYKVGDLWITGRHYGYLNFFPISRVPDAVMMRVLEENRGKKGALSLRTVEKTMEFPAFWEIDYEWWNFKHIAWYGGEFMGIKSPGGKHMGCLKTRGAGFSYKEAWDGIYNYNFIDGSKNFYFASAESYLIGDKIMDKVATGLDFINANSPFWKKNRQQKFTLMHQKASYIDSFGVPKGTMSEIIAQTVDKPGKTRGSRGRKASFEEAGTFPNLEAALEVSMGSMRESDVYVGEISVFGTGGETGKDIQGLENIFGSPEAWDMLAFPNIWEDGMYGTQCGYFVPCYRANAWRMDADGNIDIPAALDDDDRARAKKELTGKPKDLDRRKAEYPRNPAEALQRLSGNGFNIAELDKQINRIKNSKAIQGFINYGKLVTSDNSTALGGVEFINQPKSIARPIEDFPHKQGDDLTGCVSIIERPWTDQRSLVPRDMYLITFDSYYKDDSQDVTSLFSIKVWKQENPWSLSYIDLPVAWYAGRPNDLDKVYSILFNLCKYYNCTAQGEISGGGQGVVAYAKLHRMLDRLYHEPDMAHNKEQASKSAGQSYLMNMGTDRKKMGLQYLEDWHVSPRGVDEHGTLILNLHQVYDIAFLREMRKHNPEKGNYDRISDGCIGMFMLKERRAHIIKDRREKKGFYSRTLFSQGESDEQGTVPMY